MNLRTRHLQRDPSKSRLYCRECEFHVPPPCNGVSHATNAEVNEHRRPSDVRRTDGRTDDGRTTDGRRTDDGRKKFRRKNSDEKIPTKKFRRNNLDEKKLGARHGGKARPLRRQGTGNYRRFLGGQAPQTPPGGKARLTEFPEGGKPPQTPPRHHFKKFAFANFLK